MSRICSVILSSLFMLLLISTSVQANHNWPNWRGPDSTGVAPDSDPPVTWSESENIKWKVDVIGEGLSSPVIWGNKLFYLAAVKVDGSDEQKFDVVCVDRTNGKTLWHKTAIQATPHEGHHPDSSYASFSPVTDGQYVWAGFGSQGLYCYDMEGNLQWKKPLIKMSMRNRFGEAGSVALAGGNVVVVSDHEGDSAIFAFDKATGELRWSKARDERSNWNTPLTVEYKGRTEVVVNGANAVRSYDAKSGDLLWQCSGQTGIAIPMPIATGDKVICMSGFRGSTLHAIALGKQGDLSNSDAIVWQMHDGTPYVPSPVVYDNRLYFCASGGNQGIVSCYDVNTGEVLYSKQALDGINSIYASFVGAADRIYIAGRNGTVAVLKHGDDYELLAANTLNDGFSATPAIAGDELYLKGNQYLYCIAH